MKVRELIKALESMPQDSEVDLYKDVFSMSGDSGMYGVPRLDKSEFDQPELVCYIGYIGTYTGDPSDF